MYFPLGVELRDNIQFIHREMVWHHVVKIESRQHEPFGRYDDSRAEHFYSYNVIKHRTFLRKLSHINNNNMPCVRSWMIIFFRQS